MKKVMLIGCFIIGFLLLITPCVNSIEYHQVSCAINEKISVLTQRIKWLSEQVKEEDFISLNNLTKDEKLSNILDEILTNVDGICVPCAEDTCRPLCFLVFMGFIYYFVIMHICYILCVIFPSISIFLELYGSTAAGALYLLSIAQDPLHCLWAGG